MQHGISFDFWNTLYANGAEDQRHKLRTRYFHKILSAYGMISEEVVQNAFESSTRMFIENWRNKHRTPTTGERIRYMSEEIGIKIDNDCIEKTAAYFGEIIDIIPPQKIPAIKATISQLATDYPLAIISDTGYISGQYIRTFLENEKMLSYFQSLFFSDEHDHCKPHASVFHMTCQNLNIDCTNLVHIGDLEHTDVRGIKDIGGISIKYIGSNETARPESQADYVIDNYDELLPLINNITRS